MYLVFVSPYLRGEEDRKGYMRCVGKGGGGGGGARTRCTYLVFVYPYLRGEEDRKEERAMTSHWKNKKYNFVSRYCNV